jgi:hypothetical protein
MERPCARTNPNILPASPASYRLPVFSRSLREDLPHKQAFAAGGGSGKILVLMSGTGSAAAATQKVGDGYVA